MIYRTEIERAVIASVLQGSQFYFEIEDIVKPEYFEQDGGFREIFEACKDQYSNGRKYDLIEIAKNSNTQLDTLRKLIISANTPKLVEHSEELKANYNKDLLKVALSKAESVLDTEGAQSAFSCVESTYREIEGTQDEQSSHISTTLIPTMDKIINASEKKGLTGISTGLSEMDKITGGWTSTDMIVIGARPGMGKTTVSINWAYTCALEGKHVVIYSLEMSKSQITMILMSIITGIDTDLMRRGDLDKGQKDKLYKASEKLADLPIWIETKYHNIEDINHNSMMLNRRVGIDLRIIDYLQLVGSKEAKSTYDRVSHVSRELKLYSSEDRIDCCTIALSQLSRSVETRGGSKRPLLSDLRESGAIEQDADLIYFVYREGYYDPDTLEDYTELILSKNRHGKAPHTFKVQIKNRAMSQYSQNEYGFASQQDTYNPQITQRQNGFEEIPF